MQNNLTNKEINNLYNWAKKYDIEELKINDKDKIFNLTNLYIFDYTNIKHIPDSIFKLTNLKSLFISSNISDGYNNFQLPKGIWDWSNLESLCIHCGNLENLPSEIEKLINLETIYIRNCNGKLNLQDLLVKGIVKLNNLKWLSIDIE